jgi:phosphinothricin acetyltransferase
MIRIATEADVAEMLSVYAPYVLNTTVSFEYDPPTQEEFLQRFRNITCQFPWLVWEEEGKILGYAYASAPYVRAAYSWCAEPSV